MDKKIRRRIPDKVAANVLYASDRCCCVCQKRGLPVQIHHIDENPANNSLENLCVLCLHCHNETQISGGFARRLDAKLVQQYSMEWMRRVGERRRIADVIALSENVGDEDPILLEATPQLSAYVKSVPLRMAAAYVHTLPKRSGTTSDMIEAGYQLIEVALTILIKLASWYPECHFGGVSADLYFHNHVSHLYIWNRALAEPLGAGTGGTIVGPRVVSSVLADLEKSIVDMVTNLMSDREQFNIRKWKLAWEAAIAD